MRVQYNIWEGAIIVNFMLISRGVNIIMDETGSIA